MRNGGIVGVDLMNRKLSKPISGLNSGPAFPGNGIFLVGSLRKRAPALTSSAMPAEPRSEQANLNLFRTFKRNSDAVQLVASI